MFHQLCGCATNRAFPTIVPRRMIAAVAGTGRPRPAPLSQCFMTPMPIDDTDRKTITQAVRTYIAKQRISREEFAQRAKIGKSTVDKLVVGIFSEKTILQIESQLNIELRCESGGAEAAAAEFGKYTREETKRYPGHYIFARPSFQGDAIIHAFHMEVEWDRAVRALVIKERDRNKKHVQFGTIHIPRASTHIFISSNSGGWLSSTILSRLGTNEKMKGVMLTMGRIFGNVYAPMAMPVIMNKHDKIEEGMTGKLAPKSTAYEAYRNDLEAVERNQFAKWLNIRRP
jgi:hypothetical protein